MRARGVVELGVEPSGRRLCLTDSQLSAHGLILGATGAGKSTTLLALLRAHLARGGPVVAIDLKGSPSFASALAASAAAAGRPLRTWTMDGPELWNPLAVGNPTELKDKLIATERFTEPHYQRAAERYVQLALSVLQESSPERPVTLAGVVAMLDPARLAAAAGGLPRARSQYIRDYLSTLAPDQLSAVRGLASRLAVISESHVGPYLDDDREALAGGRGIDLRAALRGEEVVLFSLNSSTYGSLAAQVGTLVVQDLVAAAGGRLASRAGGPGHAPGGGVPALVGIDEFSALGSDNVLALLARGRESGMSVILATQELADLDRAGRGVRDQVLGNTAFKIAHRQDVPASAETVARLAGSQQVWERSYAVGPGPFGLSDARRGSLRLVDRYRVDPDEVRSLEVGEAVTIIKTPRASTHRVQIRPFDGGRGGQVGRDAPVWRSGRGGAQGHER